MCTLDSKAIHPIAAMPHIGQKCQSDAGGGVKLGESHEYDASSGTKNVSTKVCSS